jgi:hypothetical protein
MGWKVGAEFTKSHSNFFKDSREVGILMKGEVGDISESTKDNTKNFGLEGSAEPSRL